MRLSGCIDHPSAPKETLGRHVLDVSNVSTIIMAKTEQRKKVSYGSLIGDALAKPISLVGIGNLAKALLGHSEGTDASGTVGVKGEVSPKAARKSKTTTVSGKFAVKKTTTLTSNRKTRNASSRPRKDQC